MRTLLDTSVCVQILRGHVESVRRLSALGPEAVILPTVAIAELRYGALRAKLSRAAHSRLDSFLSVFEAVPFDVEAANLHASIRQTLATAGTPIGERDLIIASTALAHDCRVATGNLREFKRVPGLSVEAWD